MSARYDGLGVLAGDYEFQPEDIPAIVTGTFSRRLQQDEPLPQPIIEACPLLNDFTKAIDDVNKWAGPDGRVLCTS